MSRHKLDSMFASENDIPATRGPQPVGIKATQAIPAHLVSKITGSLPQADARYPTTQSLRVFIHHCNIVVKPDDIVQHETGYFMISHFVNVECKWCAIVKMLEKAVVQDDRFLKLYRTEDLQILDVTSGIGKPVVYAKCNDINLIILDLSK